MNFNKHSFLIEEFMALPVFQTVREAPVGKPFLLSNKIKVLKPEAMEKLASLNPKFDELPPIEESDYVMRETSHFASQIEYLKELIDKHTVDGIKSSLEESKKQNPKKDVSLKVTFWVKHKDGNVSDCGGRIIFPDKLTMKDDKIIINTGV